MGNVVLFVHSLQQFLLEFLVNMDLKALREIQVHLASLGEMVILVSQDSQDPLDLLVLLESVNHALLSIRTILPSLIHTMSRLEVVEAGAFLAQLVLLALLVPLVHLVMLDHLALQDTKVPLVKLVKLVLPVLLDLPVL